MDSKSIRSGFTLVEVLIVVSIVAFLAGISLYLLSSQVFKGTDAKRKSDINRIQIAIEEYEKDKDCYPTPEIVTCSPDTGLRPYLDKIPCDPKTKSSYYFENDGNICPRWYRIYTKLENKQDPYITKIGCTNGCGPNSLYNYYVSSPNAPAQ